MKAAPQLANLFSNYISNGDPDPESDLQAAARFTEASEASEVEKAAAQGKELLERAELPLEEIGTEANRWFADSEEARSWLSPIVSLLETRAGGAGSGLVVKDSNGTPLSEGDSVLVIKDLKVKGGSSDLKRGTLIRRIHLVDDPQVVECRVDGSTLVLKTQFLKKA